MNPNEIKKCLECCCSKTEMFCTKDCPLYEYNGNCWYAMKFDALAYIKQLEAEVERLNIESQRYRETVGELYIKDDKVVCVFADKGTEYIHNDLAETFKNMAVSHTIKEFAEKACNIIDIHLETFSKGKFSEFKAIRQVLRGLKNDIHNLVKEMADDKNK